MDCNEVDNDDMDTDDVPRDDGGNSLNGVIIVFIYNTLL